MAESTGKKASKAFVWLLLALLIVGLAGFGVNSFGGRATSIGSVGEVQITAQMYFRSLMRAIRVEEAEAGRSLSSEEIQARGIPAQVRAQLAGSAALDNEALRMGLSVGDALVAQQIRSQAAFQGLDGSFNREAYEFALRQNGWTVPEFEETIRAETARGVLQSAVGGAVAAPTGYLDVILDFYGERRSFDYVRFGEDSLTEPVDARTDADVAAYYDANPEAFTLPARKQITYVWLSPDDLLDEITIDEAALRSLYAERRDDYVLPERRLVERLVFADEAAAEAALEAIAAGETGFAALVEERGLSLDDVDLGEVTRDDLDAAAEAVFMLDGPGIAGPLPTALGPALFRVNAVLNATETSFEEARDDLAQEFARDAARREVEARISDYDERLAAGFTIEDLAAETEMTLGTMEIWSETRGGLADYASFRAKVAEIDEDDFAQIELLEDGGIYAVRLDARLEPSVQPLSEVRAQALQGATEAAILEAIRAVAETARTTVGATGALSSVGQVERAELITRDQLAGGAPGAVTAQAFETEQDTLTTVEANGAVYLLRVTDIQGPDPEDSRTEFLRQGLAAQLRQGLVEDMILTYSSAMTAEAGISFNDAALNTVEAQVLTSGSPR